MTLALYVARVAALQLMGAGLVGLALLMGSMVSSVPSGPHNLPAIIAIVIAFGTGAMGAAIIALSLAFSRPSAEA